MLQSIKDKMMLLTKVTHPIFFPLTYAVIIPIIWLALSGNTSISSLSSPILFTIDVIMATIQVISLWLVFIDRKGDAKTMNRALLSKNLIKMIMFFSGIMLIFSFVVGYLAFGVIVNENNVQKLDHTAKNPFMVLGLTNISTWIFFISFFILLFVKLDPRYNYGQSYAYFKTIELPRLGKIRKMANFQKGLNLYDTHLADYVNLRMKYIDKIRSSMIVDKSDSMENKIHHLTQKFTDDWLDPARYLCETLNISYDDFLQSKPHYENIEKWTKIVVAYIIPIIGLVLGIYFQYSPQQHIK